MALPLLFTDNELLMSERVGIFFLLLTSLFPNKNQKFISTFALVCFLAIYCLYVYNFLRDCWENDGKKKESTKERTERINLSNEKKEMESKFELEKEKLLSDHTHETVALMEHLRMYEEKIEIMSEINKKNSEKFDDELKMERNMVLNLEKDNAALKEKCTRFEDEIDDLNDEIDDLEARLAKSEDEMEDKCAKLEMEKKSVVGDLEKERERVLRLEVDNAALEEKCAIFEDDIDDLEERFATCEHEMEDKCAKLEKEKKSVVDDLEKERERVLRLEEENAKLKEECRGLVAENCDSGDVIMEERQCVLRYERKCRRLVEEIDEQSFRVRELEERCSRLEKEELEGERNNHLSNEIDDFRWKIAALEDRCKTLEAEKDSLANELAKESKKNKKLNKKSKIQYKELEIEKKLVEAERDNLVAMVDVQASAVEAYKEMLDKEDCLMKLFSVKMAGSELPEA